MNTHKELENIKQLASDKNFSLAYKELSKFIKDHGPISEAIFIKAKCARRLKKFDEALKLFRSLRNVPEYKIEAYWGESMIMKALGREEEAILCYEQIILLSKNMPVLRESKKALEKILKEKANNKNLLLTTFPKHASNNVGDQLISSSTISLIQSRIKNFNPIVEFRATNLDKYENTIVENIIAPGFSICDRTYPELYGLYSDIKKLPNFFPIGCSFQHTEPSFNAFDSYSYSKETLEFFKSITAKSGPLPCRDQLIVDMLIKHNISAVYSGDMAIYDEKHLNTIFIPPKEINSIVFTVGHHEKYYEQAAEILKMISKTFKNSKLYIAFHSKVSSKLKEITDLATSLGYKELHLYGDVKNLDIYNNIDLHIGYRLHGHISFLRRRKPSVLLIEDARSFGFANTKGTSFGCFDVYDVQLSKTIEDISNKILSFINKQIENDFREYENIFILLIKHIMIL